MDSCHRCGWVYFPIHWRWLRARHSEATRLFFEVSAEWIHRVSHCANAMVHNELAWLWKTTTWTNCCQIYRGHVPKAIENENHHSISICRKLDWQSPSFEIRLVLAVHRGQTTARIQQTIPSAAQWDDPQKGMPCPKKSTGDQTLQSAVMGRFSVDSSQQNSHVLRRNKCMG